MAAGWPAVAWFPAPAVLCTLPCAAAAPSPSQPLPTDPHLSIPPPSAALQGDDMEDAPTPVQPAGQLLPITGPLSCAPCVHPWSLPAHPAHHKHHPAHSRPPPTSRHTTPPAHNAPSTVCGPCAVQPAVHVPMRIRRAARQLQPALPLLFCNPCSIIFLVFLTPPAGKHGRAEGDTPPSATSLPPAAPPAVRGAAGPQQPPGAAADAFAVAAALIRPPPANKRELPVVVRDPEQRWSG